LPTYYSSFSPIKMRVDYRLEKFQRDFMGCNW